MPKMMPVVLTCHTGFAHLFVLFAAMRSSLANTEVGGPSLSLSCSSRLGHSVVSQANRPLSFSGLCGSRYGTDFP